MTWAFFFFLKISLNHVDRNLQKKKKKKKLKKEKTLSLKGIN